MTIISFQLFGKSQLTKYGYAWKNHATFPALTMTIKS